MKITRRQLKRVIKETFYKLNESLLDLPHQIPDNFDGDIMLVEKAIEIARLMGTPLPEPIETSYGTRRKIFDKYWDHYSTGTSRPPSHQVKRQKSTHPRKRTMDDKRYDGEYPEDFDKYYPPGSPQLGRTIFNRIAQLGRKMDPRSRDYTLTGAKIARHRQSLLRFGQNVLKHPEYYMHKWDDFLIDWTEEFQRL